MLDISARQSWSYRLKFAIPAGIAAGLVLAIAGAPSASAHVTANLYGAMATSGGYGTMFLRVPHGCAGDATNAVSVTIPAGIDAAGVKPQQKAGWSISRSGSTITWSGGSLPNDQFDDFGLNLKWPSLASGEASRKVYFPTVQTCDAEAKVDRSGKQATVTGSFPASAGRQVGVFAGDARIATATVGADGSLRIQVPSSRLPEGAAVTVRRGGIVLGNAQGGSEAWVQIPGDGSDLKMPAPSVTVMASSGSAGH